MSDENKSLDQEPASDVEQSQVERRRHPRVKHSMPVAIDYVMNSGHSFKFNGELMDISPAGAGVVLPRGFWCPVGQHSRVQITLKGAQGELEWIGHVARLDKNEDGFSVLGIMFEPRDDVIPCLEGEATMSLELVEKTHIQ